MGCRLSQASNSNFNTVSHEIAHWEFSAHQMAGLQDVELENYRVNVDTIYTSKIKGLEETNLFDTDLLCSWSLSLPFLRVTSQPEQSVDTRNPGKL